MIFAPSTVEKVLDGSKTETRRLVRPGRDKAPCEVGRVYAIQPGRGKAAIGQFYVKGVRKERLLDITDPGARREGFADREAFLREFVRLNRMAQETVQGDEVFLSANPEVWVIEFARFPFDPNEVQQAAFPIQEMVMKWAAGETTMEMRADFVKGMAAMMAGWFVDVGGKNFVEIRMFDPRIGQFNFLMQRTAPDAKTPVQVLDEFKARFKEFDAATVRECADFYGAYPSTHPKAIFLRRLAKALDEART
jgi:hypothetical protein